MARDVMHVLLDEITVSDKHRPVDPEAVLKLAKSIKSIGLQYPITVRSKNGAFELVAGRHRVEAHRALGLERIPANVVRWTDLDARMWEISENLHRAELTTIQRAEQVAEFVRLAKEKREADKPAQVAQVSGGRGNEGGDSLAARDLGIDREEVRRAQKIDAISDDAKEAAREAGLDNNQSALLSIAKEPVERQVERVAEIKAAGRVNDLPPVKEWEDVEHEQRRSLLNAWNRASPNVRAWFRENIVDQPIMDGRFGDAA